MSFRKPCHMPFRKLIPPFTLTEHKGIPVAINKTVGRAGRTNSKNYGLKTATKPKEETRSNLENGEFNCVKNVNIRTLLYNFILLVILFYLCVSVKWSLNCSVLSSVQKSACVQLPACFCVIEDVDK